MCVNGNRQSKEVAPVKTSRGLGFEKRVGEMASDTVVQKAVQTLNAELCQIRLVLERIAAALERQAELTQVL